MAFFDKLTQIVQDIDNVSNKVDHFSNQFNDTFNQKINDFDNSINQKVNEFENTISGKLNDINEKFNQSSIKPQKTMTDITNEKNYSDTYSNAEENSEDYDKKVLTNDIEITTSQTETYIAGGYDDISKRIVIQGISISPKKALQKIGAILQSGSFRGLKAIEDGGRTLYSTIDREESILVENILWDFSFDREYIWIYDCKGNKVGKVRQHRFAPGIFEKDKEKSSVYVYDKKICTLKNFHEIFDRSYQTQSVDESLYSITGDTKNTFHIIGPDSRKIANVYRCYNKNNSSDIYDDKFEIEPIDYHEILQSVAIVFGIILVEKEIIMKYQGKRGM